MRFRVMGFRLFVLEPWALVQKTNTPWRTTRADKGSNGIIVQSRLTPYDVLQRTTWADEVAMV